MRGVFYLTHKTDAAPEAPTAVEAQQGFVIIDRLITIRTDIFRHSPPDLFCAAGYVDQMITETGFNRPLNLVQFRAEYHIIKFFDHLAG